MNSPQRQYIAIDLKSFYASVECIERGLDPLDACLVVADQSRTDKTICLAVSPALKAYGVGGRPRLFEVIQRVREINRSRGHAGRSSSGAKLAENPDLQLDYIVAPPRMARYIEFSTRIYNIYLRYIAPEDIHVYSVDEVFIDATSYLATYKLSAHDLAMKLIREVLRETGVTATAGIGSNLYLCKVAMDIVAKKMKPDRDGVRIAQLNEISYRHQLWNHKPLTDFWRVGRGIANKLGRLGLLTMGDIARYSLSHEESLYRLFGVNAELLIDHAWGWEPVTMAQIKAYRPATHSISSGQVLSAPYPTDKARIVTIEMANAAALDLLDKQLLSRQVVLEIGYDRESLTNPTIRAQYDGRIALDHYGRQVPFHAHGTINLDTPTSSAHILAAKIASLFDRVVNPILLVRRITLSFNHLMPEATINLNPPAQQLELFVDYDELHRQQQLEAERRNNERRRQQAVLRIKQRFGKNAILTGLNFADGATQKARNSQIGGHNA